jgi:hypothetical protein
LFETLAICYLSYSFRGDHLSFYLLELSWGSHGKIFFQFFNHNSSFNSGLKKNRAEIRLLNSENKGTFLASTTDGRTNIFSSKISLEFEYQANFITEIGRHLTGSSIAGGFLVKIARARCSACVKTVLSYSANVRATIFLINFFV